MTTETLTDRAAALHVLTGGDEALTALAGQYADAYDADPGAFCGMLAASLHVQANMLADVHELMGKIAPVINDPSALLDSLPPTLRAMLGV